MMKYKENETIKVVEDYISQTYRSHYSNEEKGVQTLDLLEAIGSAEHFCQSNIIKYASRYKKKGKHKDCLLYTSPSPRDVEESRMPSSA